MSTPTFPIDLVRSSLKDVVVALENGTITSVALINAYLERIEQHNTKGLELRAVIETAPREKLIALAEKLDKERGEGKARGTLHGIPIIVKDTIYTDRSMGMETTGGIVAFEGSVVPSNADVIDQLINQGVIILGKANLSALNNFYSTSGPDGWSPRGGQTGSAWGYGKDTYTSSGSSTGSAVGLSAGFCAASVGAETNGSIISPARRAGIYAMKAGRGTVSSNGAISLSQVFDLLGPMGKTTWDLAAMLGAMSITPTDYLPYVNPSVNDLSLYKLGIPRKWFDPDASGSEVFPEDIKTEARELFASIVNKLNPAIKSDPADIPGIEALWGGPVQTSDWRDKPLKRIYMTHFWEAIHDHLSKVGNCEIKTLEDLVRWNDANPGKAWPDAEGPPRDQGLRNALEGGGAKDDQYFEFVKLVDNLGKKVEETMDSFGIDAFLFPGALGPQAGKEPQLATSGGFPIATMPVGILSNGDPYAINFIGRRGSEGKLLSIMSACEAVVGIHPVPPRLALNTMGESMQ